MGFTGDPAPLAPDNIFEHVHHLINSCTLSSLGHEKSAICAPARESFKATSVWKTHTICISTDQQTGKEYRYHILGLLNVSVYIAVRFALYHKLTVQFIHVFFSSTFQPLFALEFKERYIEDGWTVYDPVAELKRQVCISLCWRSIQLNPSLPAHKASRLGFPAFWVW